MDTRDGIIVRSKQMNITRGKRDSAYSPWTTERDTKMRTYDRLRKASYRRINYMDLNNYWTAQHHQAYVQGVRDALQ